MEVNLWMSPLFLTEKFDEERVRVCVMSIFFCIFICVFLGVSLWAMNGQMLILNVSTYVPQCVSTSKYLSLSFVLLKKLPTCSFQPWEAFHCAVRLVWQGANSNTFSHANFYRSRNNEYITVIK